MVAPRTRAEVLGSLSRVAEEADRLRGNVEPDLDDLRYTVERLVDVVDGLAALLVELVELDRAEAAAATITATGRC